MKIFSSQRRALNADESTVEVTVRTHDTTPILDEINSPGFEPELRSKLSGATEENIFVRNATVTSVTDITTTTQAAESNFPFTHVLQVIIKSIFVFSQLNIKILFIISLTSFFYLTTGLRFQVFRANLFYSHSFFGKAI